MRKKLSFTHLLGAVLALSFIAGFAAFVLSGATTNKGTTGAISSERATIMTAEKTSLPEVRHVRVDSDAAQGRPAHVQTGLQLRGLPTREGLRDDHHRLPGLPVAGWLKDAPQGHSRRPQGLVSVLSTCGFCHAAPPFGQRVICTICPASQVLEPHLPTQNAEKLGLALPGATFGPYAQAPPAPATVGPLSEGGFGLSSKLSISGLVWSRRLVLAVVLGAVGFGAGPASAQSTGTTFLAASNTQPAFDFMTQDFIQTANGGNAVTFSYAGSGKLAGEIDGGVDYASNGTGNSPAGFALFASADEANVDNTIPAGTPAAKNKGAVPKYNTGQCITPHSATYSAANGGNNNGTSCPGHRLHACAVHHGTAGDLLLPKWRQHACAGTGCPHVRRTRGRLLHEERCDRGTVDDGPGMD